MDLANNVGITMETVYTMSGQAFDNWYPTWMSETMLNYIGKVQNYSTQLEVDSNKWNDQEWC